MGVPNKVSLPMNDLTYSYPGERRRRKKKSRSRSWLALGVLLGVCCFVAAIGARIAIPEVHSWYSHLAKPRHNPSTWTFAPAWIAFYTIMGVAAWIVWRVRNASLRLDALVLFCIQLVLNLAWVVTFFYLHRLLVAAVVLLVVWFAIAFTAILFWQVRRGAGVLILVCLILLSYAVGLNLVLLRLN
jgi:translocator protein